MTKYKNIFILQDNSNFIPRGHSANDEKFYNLAIHEDENLPRPRWRRAQTFLIENYRDKIITDLSDVNEETDLVIYEVGTREGPYWWLGGMNPDYPNLTNMFDIINITHPKLYSMLKNRTAILHIDQVFEAFPLIEENSINFSAPHNKREYIYSIYKKFLEYDIDPRQVFYSTSNLIEKDIHDAWCADHGIQNKMNILNRCYFAQFARYFRNDSLTVADHLNAEKTKTFSCLNRIVRTHRVALVLMLEYYNLLEGSDTSFAGCDNVTVERLYPHPATSEMQKEKLKSKLPLVLDQSDFSINQAGNFFRETYLRSYFSVITETYFTDFESTSFFFSEKIFKPIRACHPFILVGRHGSLKKLQEMGFKTFSSVWDESYDSITDPTGRLDAICSLIMKLNKKTREEWMETYVSLTDIFEHNFNHLMNTKWVDHSTIINTLRTGIDAV